MRISSVMGSYGMDSYRISSVHGNPYSMKPVERVGSESNQAGKPLVLATKKAKEDLYVKDYGELENARSTATGSFAEMLGIQEELLVSDDKMKQQDNYSDYLNDTIGMMGMQNRLRDQLNGVGFVPFS